MNATHGLSLIARCLASLAAAAALLAGCTMQPAAKALSGQAAPRVLGDYKLECDKQGGNECWVPIIVTGDASINFRCTVAYVFSEIHTPKNVKIIWYLNRTEGYEFDAAKGIDIKNNNGAFEGNGHNGGRKHQFTWRARAVGSEQRRNYDIVVRPTGGGEPCDFTDPVIFNRG
jgi:hypothetical protein